MASKTAAAPATSNSTIVGIGELLECILVDLSTEDLAIARRISRNFEVAITGSKLKEMQQKMFLAPKYSTEFVVWKQQQPYIADQPEGDRGRPITLINPIFERCGSQKTIADRQHFFGHKDTEIRFDGQVFMKSVPDDSFWNQTLVSQCGATSVMLRLCVEELKKESGYPSQYEEMKDAGLMDDFLERATTVDIELQWKEFTVTGPVTDTGRHFVTIADIKDAIQKWQRENFGEGTRLVLEDVRMTVVGCVTEKTRCVQQARLSAAERKSAVIEPITFPP